MTTPRLGAPELVSGQAAPETTVNEIAAYFDAFACPHFKDRDLATPPGSPAAGDCYLVAASPTGAWTGQAGKVAIYLNTAWIFVTAKEGFLFWVDDEDILVNYDGSAWNTVGLSSGSFIPSSYLDTDDTLVADSDTKVATQQAVKAYVDAAVSGAGGGDSLAVALPVTFNFTDTGEARFYADVAMTLTEQATSGTGTIAYEKSTSAAPGTFSSTTSPVTLEAGAWLKVSASSVTDIVAVHLKRTA